MSLVEVGGRGGGMEARFFMIAGAPSWIIGQDDFKEGEAES